MSDGVARLDYRGLNSDAKPPLDLGVRVRLSVMMFLQFAVWGGWFTAWGIYCEHSLGFNKLQIGFLYSTMALGAIVSNLVAGQLADRVLSSEYLMAIFHLVGAVLLYAMATIHDYHTLWIVAFAYALVYNPTIAISNSISFANVPDSTRDFPSLRVLGTIGWIAAGLSVDYLLPAGSEKTNAPLLMCAGISAALGLFSFALPHTPPSGKKGDAVPFLRALGLLKDPSFGIFFGISFIITIALAFYYNFAPNFLTDIHIKNPVATQTLGQASEIIFMLLLPFALKRFGMKGVLTLGMGAWAVRYGLFSLEHPLALIYIAIALHGVCFDFFLAAGFIYTDNKAPADIRSSAQALFTFLTYGLGMYIGNLVGGMLAQYLTTPGGQTEWSKFWAVPAIGAAVCLLLFLILWKDTPGKVDPLEEPRGFAVSAPGGDA
ncbi:MAG TPA: MFS transporter [Tepidisphaeraceae bacterium]|nr:MFS transporter [Tepidisphaeraceae bacterium]